MDKWQLIEADVRKLKTKVKKRLDNFGHRLIKLQTSGIFEHRAQVSVEGMLDRLTCCFLFICLSHTSHNPHVKRIHLLTSYSILHMCLTKNRY